VSRKLWILLWSFPWTDIGLIVLVCVCVCFALFPLFPLFWLGVCVFCFASFVLIWSVCVFWLGLLSVRCFVLVWCVCVCVLFCFFCFDLVCVCVCVLAGSAFCTSFCFVWCGLVRVCVLCVVCLVVFLFSVLWVGLVSLPCFGWFRFGVGRGEAKC